MARFRPSFPVVEAKLRLPVAHPSTVDRPRLTRLLLAEPRSPVVSVVAPPGYGKTMLMAGWAAQETRDVAWLTLDEYDNEPGVLLTYLATAIDRIEPVDPDIEAALTARGPRVLSLAVPRLASQLHRHGRPGVLILDDLHRLHDRSCLDALALLIDFLPPGFQVAIAARTPPGLPLARYRADRRLLELGRQELAFDGRETVRLAAAAGRRLTSAQATALAERTEGWAAAIYLATLARGRGEVSPTEGADVSGRERYIADYLWSELLPLGDAADVALLTRTSILATVEPGLAEAVSELPDASERLRRLAHDNLLIGEVGGTIGAYRFHNLLTDQLRAELERREPGLEPQLHRRAAAWYSGAGHPELAVEHLLACGDVDEAALLVEQGTVAMYLQGQGDRLERWLSRFDDDVFQRRPGLTAVAALVHGLSGQPDAARRLADILERAGPDGAVSNGAASVASTRAMLRAAMVPHGPADALANARTALALESGTSPWRPILHDLLALAHVMLDDPAAADAVLAAAVDAVPPTSSYAFFALAARASLAMARRDWEAADRFARGAHDRFARMHFEAAASSVLVHAVCARTAIHHGDVARAREELVHAQIVRPLASWALPSTSVLGLVEVARAYLSLADPAGAANALSEAERILRHRPDLGTLAGEVAELRHRTRVSAEALVGPSTLTPAELRVLPMLSTHLAFDEIADRLGVSRHTVKTQAMSIYAKLGVSGRSEAIERAIEIGLLEPFPGLRLAGRPGRG